MRNAIENIGMGRSLGDEGLANCGVNCGVDLTVPLRDWAANRDWKRDIATVAPLVLGAGLSLAFKNPDVGTQAARLATQNSIDPALVQWVPPAVMEVGAFIIGAASGFRDATSGRYKERVIAWNEQLTAQIKESLAQPVSELAEGLVKNGKLSAGKKEEFIEEKLIKETAGRFARHPRRAIKPTFGRAVRHAVLEGLEMGVNLGGLGLLTSDVMIGMETPRLVADLAFAGAGLTSLRRQNPSERLWNSTIVSPEE